MTDAAVQHVGGVWWYEASIPCRWHRCKPQTYGWVNSHYVERCACGATRLDHHKTWLDKNQRRNRR